MVLFQREETNMRRKRTFFSISNKKGFTLIELLMVVAILGVLTTIAIRRAGEERQKANDARAVTFMRNLLTRVETEPPASSNPYFPGDALDDYPDIKLGTGMYLNVINDPEDRWQFWLAHKGGALGFFFWIPGVNCAVELDDALSPDVVADRLVPSFDQRGDYPAAILRSNAAPGIL
jgi:prepilin-type N-terminal cleavage/methylation domain-containing protein